MMGPTHSMMGAAGGLGFSLLANSLGWTSFTPVEALVFSGIVAGAALLPDLDHPNATIAQTWGPISRLLAHVTNKFSAGIMNLTAGPKDAKVSNGHRGFTHTAVFVVLSFFATYVLLSLGGFWAGIGLFYVLVSLALQGLAKKHMAGLGAIVSNIVAIVLTLIASQLLPSSFDPTFLAIGVGLGVFIHILGDAPTISGVPFAAPIIAGSDGKRWNSQHLLPEPLRFRAAGPMNTITLYVSTAATIIMAGMVVFGSALG